MAKGFYLQIVKILKSLDTIAAKAAKAPTKNGDILTATDLHSFLVICIVVITANNILKEIGSDERV